MKTIGLTGFVLAAGLAFSGAAQAADFKMGVTGPITGANAAFGAQLQNGTQQAVDDLNAKGGILGNKIVLEVGDDVSDPKQGVSVANKFVGDGVKFVVGPFNSGVAIPSSQVYNENGILMITPSATNPKLTMAGLWNVFRTCGTDDQQGMIAGKYIEAHFKGKKIAILDDKTTYGKGLADVVTATLSKDGVKPVLHEGVNAGEKDYSAVVSKVKASGADVVYWGGLHPEGGLIRRQMTDQGVKATMMSGDGITDNEFAAIAGPGAEGTLMTFPAGPAQERHRGDGGQGVRGQELRSPGLHPLQLRRRSGDRAGRGVRQVDRAPQSRGRDPLGHGVPYRRGRPLLRQERRSQDRRLRDLHLEQAARRQDHLHPERLNRSSIDRTRRPAARRAFSMGGLLPDPHRRRRPRQDAWTLPRRSLPVRRLDAARRPLDTLPLRA